MSQNAPSTKIPALKPGPVGQQAQRSTASAPDIIGFVAGFGAFVTPRQVVTLLEMRLPCHQTPLGVKPQRGAPRIVMVARTKKQEHVLEMALSGFDAASVVRLQLHREADVANVGDLLLHSLEDWEALAEQKGGILLLLDEKCAKVYRARAPRAV